MPVGSWILWETTVPHKTVRLKSTIMKRTCRMKQLKVVAVMQELQLLTVIFGSYWAYLAIMSCRPA